MTVPLSEAVARSEPVELMERKEMGALCAWMTLATVSERVEKSRTSPVGCWAAAPAEGGMDVAWLASGEVGEGTGEGYARYELSAEGERAHIAVGTRFAGVPYRTGGAGTHLLGWPSFR